jgi:hypothetical protein
LLTEAQADAAARVLALATHSLPGRQMLITGVDAWPDYSRALEKRAADAFSAKVISGPQRNL